MNLRRRPSEEEAAWQETIRLWDASVEQLKATVDAARTRAEEDDPDDER